MALAFCVGILCARAVADVTSAADAPAIDGSNLFLKLNATPAADIKTVAAKFTKSYPGQIRTLAVDLIFYRWAAASLETNPGIDKLDDITSSLVAASSDRAVIWTASELGPASWGAKPLQSDEADDTVKAVQEARKSLRSALGFAASGSPSKSIDGLTACEASLHNLGLELSAALLDNLLGRRHLYTTRRYRDAETFYNRAVPVLGAYGLRPEVARIYQDLGRLNEELGAYSDANEIYSRSAVEWKAIGRGDLAGEQYVNAGFALKNQGKSFYLGVMTKGLDESRDYASAHPDAYEFHARLLMRVTDACMSVGNYDGARKLMSEPDLARILGNTLVRAEVLGRLAAACKKTGTTGVPCYNAANSERTKILSGLAQKAQDALPKLDDGNLTADARMDLCSTIETGADAIIQIDPSRCQQSIDLIKPVVSLYDTLQRDDDKIRALRSLASYEDLLGDRAAGIDARLQGAKLAGEKKNYALAVDILRDIQGSVHNAGDKNTENDVLKEAIQVAERAGDLRAEADLLLDKGSLLLSMGDTSNSVHDLQTASTIYGDLIGDLWSAASCASKEAEGLTAAGDDDQAIKVLASMADRIEKWAVVEGIDPGMELAHADTLVHLYVQLVGLEVHAKRGAEAAAHLRTAKQYSWYQRIYSLLSAMGDPDVTRALSSVPISLNPPVIHGTPQKVAKGWLAVVTHPAFSRFAIRGRNTSRAVVDAVDIYTIRNKLPANMAIVAYALDDSDVFILYATRSTANIWQIAGANDRVVGEVQTFHDSVEELEKIVSAQMPLPPVNWSDQKSWDDPKVVGMINPLENLYTMLVKPIKDDLVQGQIGSVVFALPDKLAVVPFHALSYEETSPTRSMRFLAQDYTISYLTRGRQDDLVSPSAGAISAKKETVAIFVNTALAGSGSEARSIVSQFPNSKVVTAATADAFVRACASAGIVHISTHHQADPDPSRIEIALSSNTGGKVGLADLLKIRNPGLHMAVLSACDSIGSADGEASGSTHIAEAFRMAGFPTFVGGLWKVSDYAAPQLMSSFYRILAQTGQKALSLRRAQETMIKSPNGAYAHPYYWASFALYGDPR